MKKIVRKIVNEDSEVGCRMQDAGCRMQDAGCRMQDAGCKMQDAGCGMQEKYDVRFTNSPRTINQQPKP
ncbi:MAG: hypothetical protein WCO02_06870 [Bacteroidota bacterium]